MSPTAAKRVAPGPFVLFDGLKNHGAGANYDARVAHGAKGWAVFGPEPEPSPFRYLLGRKIAQPQTREGLPMPGGASLDTDEVHARIAADLVVLFVLLNPSTADQDDNDPTITRCIGYATDWGYSNLWVANAFAYRSKDPYAMIKAHKRGEDVIGPLNDPLIRCASSLADRVVCAWGNHARLGDRAAALRKLIEGDAPDGADHPVPHVLKLNHKTREPVHPLYQPRALQARPWWLVERE